MNVALNTASNKVENKKSASGISNLAAALM
jgi:hypothetical protein